MGEHLVNVGAAPAGRPSPYGRPLRIILAIKRVFRPNPKP
jgi:hypothetical protein